MQAARSPSSLSRHAVRLLALSLSLVPVAAPAAADTPSAVQTEPNPTVYVARYEDHGDGTRRLIGVIGTDPVGRRPVAADGIDESSYPQFVDEHSPVSQRRIVELRSESRDALNDLLDARAVAAATAVDTLEGLDEVVTLVDSGPVDNRIDLVFMGDGYTQDERAKFFADIQRMVREMFEGPTFKSYLPLFNVHAVFRASNESGIGKNDQPKDTAYQLYREGETLRAIYPGDIDAARASCAAAPGCDYPVLIANDPYYGGLGGEFAISTSSVTSGTVVLRHELGHNFGRVGEEYDGGGYFGANSSPSVARLKWSHWATAANVTAEPVVARVLGWPWHNLSQGPYVATFTSAGTAERAFLRFSASGIRTNDTLAVTIDGAPVPFRSRDTDDRTFQDIYFATGFAAGAHELRFAEQIADGNNWVSNLLLLEFGAGYHYDADHIGAYPVFNPDGSIAAYRSNHETCLMRNMQSTTFCKICQENNWLEFFGKVKLIDRLSVARSTDRVQVTAETQKLGQLRTPADPNGRLEFRWQRNGVAVPSLNDLATWSLPARDAAGEWNVEARFVTNEVRKDTRNLTRDRRRLSL